MLKGFATATTTISPVFLNHVEILYRKTLEIIEKRDPPYRNHPEYTENALPAYILAVAAIEAFVNETFLSKSSSMILDGTFASKNNKNFSQKFKKFFCRILFKKTDKSIEKLPLAEKIIKIPREVVGRSLEKGQQPYQDMKLLINLRNEITHYKMGMLPPKCVRVLAQRGIATKVPPEQESGGPHPWVNRISTLEGIRWAQHTVCDTALNLIDLFPEEKRKYVEPFKNNYRKLS